MKKEKNVLTQFTFELTKNIICRRWSLQIINEIENHGKLRYSDLLHELKGISPSTLASILEQLKKEKIIKKESFNQGAPTVKYSLLPRGRELLNILTPLHKWVRKGD